MTPLQAKRMQLEVSRGEEVIIPLSRYQELQAVMRRTPPTSKEGLDSLRGVFNSIVAPHVLPFQKPIETWIMVEGGEMLVWFERDGASIHFTPRLTTGAN